MRQRALLSQSGEAGIDLEHLLVGVVGDPRVGQRCRTLELHGLWRADGVETLVHLGVDARDEERRHGVDLRDVVSCGERGVEPVQVGVHDLLVALHREDQGDVDADALGEGAADRRQAFFRCRDLDQRVGTVDDLPQLHRLSRGLLGVVRQTRVHLDRHPTVEAVGAVEDRPQDVACVTDVVGRQCAHRAVDVGVARGQLVDLVVIGSALGQSGLEDRRVGRHAHHGFGVDEFLELPRADQVSGQVVQPHRNPGCGQFCELLVLCHGSLLQHHAPCGSASSGLPRLGSRC